MTVSFGGLPCRDPVTEASYCQSRGWPVAPWWGDANGFRCPLGVEPGRGVVLMARADALSLSATALYPLSFCDGANTVALKSLLFVRAYCVTPGARGDPSATYAVELADRRYLARASVIDAAYNLRATPGAAPGCYLPATRNAGAAWTWAAMAAAVWNAVGQLGAFPGLPFAPDGTPEGFSFYGDCAYDALAVVLDRLSCELAYNPITDAYSIVRYGAADAVNAAALGLRDARRLYDTDPIESNRGRAPRYLRVYFPAQRTNQDATGASPYYRLDQSDPTAGGALANAEPGTYAVYYDDLAATYDATGTLTNSAALASRALERAVDYFRGVRMNRLERVYAGGFPDAGLRPGAQVSAVRWIDRGGGDGPGAGLLTEVERYPGGGAWPAKKRGDDGGVQLARQILSDGTVVVRPTGDDGAGSVVLSTGGGPTLDLVTNVCPLLASGSGGGTTVVGLNVEYSTVTLPAGSVVGQATCAYNPTNCCPNVYTQCSNYAIPRQLCVTISNSVVPCLNGSWLVGYQEDGGAYWSRDYVNQGIASPKCLAEYKIRFGCSGGNWYVAADCGPQHAGMFLATLTGTVTATSLSLSGSQSYNGGGGGAPCGSEDGAAGSGTINFSVGYVGPGGVCAGASGSGSGSGSGGGRFTHCCPHDTIPATLHLTGTDGTAVTLTASPGVGGFDPQWGGPAGGGFDAKGNAYDLVCLGTTPSDWSLESITATGGRAGFPAAPTAMTCSDPSWTFVIGGVTYTITS